MNRDTLPQAILRHLEGCPLEDRTFSGRAGVFFCPRGEGLYLRVNASGGEKNHALMTDYFAGKGLGPRLVEYVDDGERDYLLTQAVPGENALAPHLLAQPERLVKALGKAFRRLHEIRERDIPVQGFSDWFLRETEEFLEEALRESTPEAFAACYGISPEQARAALPGIRRHEGDFSLIHGDACLPNVMFSREFVFTGFIDLGEARLGDRHYDLAATLWSLGHNLKSRAYGDVFLDAYGRDYVDEDRLALCALSWYGGFLRGEGEFGYTEKRL